MHRDSKLSILVTLLATFLCSPAFGQAPEAPKRVGLIISSTGLTVNPRTLLSPELQRRGFVEGRTLSLDVVSRPPGEVAAAAKALVQQAPEVIVAVGGRAIDAARAETTTIPIVMLGADTLVFEERLNLARPAGNLTGVTIGSIDLEGKRLQLLAEATPGRQLAGVALRGNPGQEARRRSMNEGAKAIGAELGWFEIGKPEEFQALAPSLGQLGVKAVALTANPEFLQSIAMTAPIAIAADLAMVCHWQEMAREGCLMSYGPSLPGLYARVAHYVALILRGARVSDLPIETPSRFELVLNMKTAKALGINFPPLLLARADEIIE